MFGPWCSFSIIWVATAGIKIVQKKVLISQYMFTPFIVPLKDIKRVNNSWKTSPKIKEAAQNMVVFCFSCEPVGCIGPPICDVGRFGGREGKKERLICRPKKCQPSMN